MSGVNSCAESVGLVVANKKLLLVVYYGLHRLNGKALLS